MRMTRVDRTYEGKWKESGRGNMEGMREGEKDGGRERRERERDGRRKEEEAYF
jgi:hypothetical protein